MSSPARLLPLCLGLAVGASASWVLRPLVRPPAPAPAPPPISASPPPSALRPFSPSALLLLPPRLAGPDADAALDSYLALPPLAAKAPRADIAERSGRLRALLTLLPTSSLDRLFAALATRTGDAEGQLRRLAFDVWVERDAPAAALWAAALVPGEAINAQARSRYLTQAARAWARRDFDSAYTWASTLPDSALRKSVSGDLLARLAATDPTRALALARAGGEEFLAATQRDIFNAWAKNNPSAAILALGAPLLADNQGRWRVAEMLGKWAVSDPQAAFAWLDTQSGLDPDTLRNTLWSLVNQVANNDKTSDLRPFADVLATRAQAGQGQRQLSDLLRSWSARDTPAALAWLDSIPDVALRNDLLAEAASNYSSDAPEKSIPLALRLPPGPLRDNALANTLGHWADDNPDAALAWLRAHDDPSLTAVAERIQGQLLGKLAANDPAAALARWQNLPANEARITAAPGIAKAWAKSDPAAAARWISAQLPELPNIGPADFGKLSPKEQADLQQKFMSYQGHFEVLQSTLSTWSRTDPAAAVAWAEGLTSPMLKEGLLMNMAQSYGPYDADTPDRAVRADQIAAITEPAIRDRVLAPHLENWLRSDLKAAREWIDTHDALSPEKAAELLTKADPSHP
ncbi:MAG: hypothetical protein RIQ79_1912 [Verrucomicrobiota bacterium]